MENAMQLHQKELQSNLGDLDEFGQELSGDPLTASENKQLRKILVEAQRERWLRKRLKVVWPWVLAVGSALVWAIDWIPKHLK